jgi:predicted HTH transcriptional regulator
MATESIITTRKYYKRNKILNIIRSNENISRYDVKKMTMYSMSTVLDIIDDLIASGMVYEAD